MNDPFSIQMAQQGASREGMDAPDLQVRMAQLKAQQGAPLTQEETRRLAVRMGLETEAAKQDISRGLSGDQTMFGPRSTSVYEGLRGGSLDPVLSAARVQSARLASDPVLAARSQSAAQLASAGFDPRLAGTSQGSDVFANYEVAKQNALRNGSSIQEEMAAQSTYAPPVVQGAGAFAPQVQGAVAPLEANMKSTPITRAAADIRGRVTPTVDSAQLPAYLENETNREIVNMGRPVSLATVSKIRASVSQRLAPTEQEVISTDPLTGHQFASKVSKNARGDIFSVGEPVMVKANPVTEKTDTDFSKDMSEWSTSGAVTQEADAKMLRTLAASLPSMTLASGFVAGLANKIGIQDYVLPDDSVDAAETIRGIAQRGARAILGAAFTEKEGTALMNRAFNPALGREVNAARALRMANVLEQAAAAKLDKAAYFENHGTTAGYKGKTFTLSDLDNAVMGKGTAVKEAPVRTKAQSTYLDKFK